MPVGSPLSGKEESPGRRPVWQWIAGLLVVFPLLWGLWLGSYALLPGPGSAESRIEVVIPRAQGFKGIKKVLVANRVIRDDFRFTLLAALTGASGKLKAGEYAFAGRQSPFAVLEALKGGKVIRRRVTLPEGLDLWGVTSILAAGDWIDPAVFLDYAQDPGFIRKLGLKVDSLEGYLFPDTYMLSREQQDERDILRMMVSRALTVFNEEKAGAVAGQKAGAVGRETELSLHQILTLASIVEKETGKDFERPLVAGVFINRLRRKMRLQADPTVIYGMKNFDGNLTRRDLGTPSPYNTYLNRGLPPGPIANPGRAAIAAVFAPSREPYLYFVAKQDGTHHFSRTLREHNRAVRKYQKRVGR